MRKERQHFTAEQKVAILRRHLLDKVPVSELCEELNLRPTVFYRWQKELFEKATSTATATGDLRGCGRAESHRTLQNFAP